MPEVARNGTPIFSVVSLDVRSSERKSAEKERKTVDGRERAVSRGEWSKKKNVVKDA